MMTVILTPWHPISPFKRLRHHSFETDSLNFFVDVQQKPGRHGPRRPNQPTSARFAANLMM